ncbi:MAG: LysR family transcriptional regulator, partial [Cyanobacteria bacterium J06576_12]
MLLKIPALSSLYTFAAVGKHLSFRKAADELLLTPGAVSQKIKALEGQLGCKLFRRTNRE